MSRILLLLENRENRRLLMESLISTHEVIVPETEDALEEDFDLCLIDGPALERLWQQVVTRKNADASIFLPFLLITSRQDMGLATRHIWQSIDELIITPIERVELHARVEVLLRTRNATIQTESRRMECETQAREVTTILKTLPVGVFILDHEGGIVSANNCCHQVWGGSIPEIHRVSEYRRLQGWRVDNGTPLTSQEWPPAKAVQHGIVTLNEEIAIQRFDGTRGAILNSASPLRDEQGDITGGVWVIQDITERKTIETERGRLLAEYDATINSTADGLAVFDPDGKLVRVNPSVARMLQYSREDDRVPLEKYFADLVFETPDGQPIQTEDFPLTKALRGDEVCNTILVTHSPGKAPLWLSSSAAPIINSHGAMLGAVVSFTDVSAVHALQEQQKVLLQTVSHDLRSPMSIIKGYAELINAVVKQEGGHATIQKNLLAIDRSITRMDAMIQDLLDVTLWESGQFVLKRAKVNLRRYLDDMLHQGQYVLDTTRIQLDVPEALPWINVDSLRLERILLNLLSNALKYSAADSQVQVQASMQDDSVQIAIADQGRGIPRQALPYLFQRFYRVPGERKSEGIGLGLYITRVMVEAHGGRIWVESAVGKGSTFYFTLPIALNEPIDSSSLTRNQNK